MDELGLGGGGLGLGLGRCCSSPDMSGVVAPYDIGDLNDRRSRSPSSESDCRRGWNVDELGLGGDGPGNGRGRGHSSPSKSGVVPAAVDRRKGSAVTTAVGPSDGRRFEENKAASRPAEEKEVTEDIQAGGGDAVTRPPSPARSIDTDAVRYGNKDEGYWDDAFTRAKRGTSSLVLFYFAAAVAVADAIVVAFVDCGLVRLAGGRGGSSVFSFLRAVHHPFVREGPTASAFSLAYGLAAGPWRRRARHETGRKGKGVVAI